MMNFSLYITVDDSIKNDYFTLSTSGFEDELININLYTNGKNKIDFRTACFLSFQSRNYIKFSNCFAKGKSVIRSIELIYISTLKDQTKNTLKDNRLIGRFLKNNKNLLNKKLRINVGNLSLTKEDVESLKPLEKYKNILVTYDETSNYHTIKDIEDIYSIVSEVVRRTKKHMDFTPIEQILYAYDLIRTNLIGIPEYEEKMNRTLDVYKEPSFCYAYIFKLVLDRFDIKNRYALGEFDGDDTRAFNIAYIEDEEYEIKGIYYFDLSNNSKVQFENSLFVNPEKDTFEDYVVNNYKFFCKPKWFIEDCDGLDQDYMFGDFDDEFMEFYEHMEKKEGINGVYKIRRLINNVSYFLNDEALIDAARGIQSEEELSEIKATTDEFAQLFSKPIEGDDFLEILFNVRQEQYKENNKVFPFGLETFKTCLSNSQFALSNMMPEFDQDKKYEQEDIDKVLDEAFEYSFDEIVTQTKIEERIKKLNLTLNRDPNKTKKDDDK